MKKLIIFVFLMIVCVSVWALNPIGKWHLFSVSYENKNSDLGIIIIQKDGTYSTQYYSSRWRITDNLIFLGDHGFYMEWVGSVLYLIPAYDDDTNKLYVLTP